MAESSVADKWPILSLKAKPPSVLRRSKLTDKPVLPASPPSQQSLITLSSLPVQYACSMKPLLASPQ
ncbi:hypothetical protein KCP73_15905 [Salmonella enterica subsp. enterica]|nr:hypothetical protein KCP73_15905 [Salmonella enterica subsp. enterica]